MTELSYQYRGQCACGGVKIVYHCAEELSRQTARSCQCEFCVPQAALYLSTPGAKLEVSVRDRRWLYAHRFGTASADFMHCARCNTLTHVQSRIDGDVYALVCANILDAECSPEAVELVSYEGETLEERLRRRARRWIPEIEVRQSGAR